MSPRAAGPSATAPPIPLLRPYQRRIARAVLGSVLGSKGLSFSVLVARQGGKNELSAQIELALLLACHRRPIESIKCAPTFDPQCRISLRRLWQRLAATPLVAGSGAGQAAGAGAMAAVEDGNAIRLGAARQRFLSAEPGAHVAGHTAFFLEVDEAQDVASEKFTRDFLPMGAAAAATVVYYGTAWDETCLLAQARERHLQLERRDGVQRHFEVPWQEVAACNAAYGRYVAAEQERLGVSHPLFQTQYLLRTIAGAGRLLSPAVIAALQGSHPALAGRPGGEPPATAYVGGLDVGGETLQQGGRDADATVLSIARVLPAAAGAAVRDSVLELVRQYAWQGTGHAVLAPVLAGLVRDRWRLRRLAVDATGIGEGLAASLAALPGGPEVLRLRLSRERKSHLGYALQAAAAAARLRLHAPDGSAEERALRFQLERARAVYHPNRLLAFDVDPAEGHDDHLLSLALAVEAAAGMASAIASGRRQEPDD